VPVDSVARPSQYFREFVVAHSAESSRTTPSTENPSFIGPLRIPAQSRFFHSVVGCACGFSYAPYGLGANALLGAGYWSSVPLSAIPYMFLRKAFHVHEAVIALCKAGMASEAYALSRVLVEMFITLRWI
jgi:hypothetical protein